MTTQREKDLKAVDPDWLWDDEFREVFADGAEYARKEVAKRLEDISNSTTDPATGLKLDGLIMELKNG